MKRQLALTSLFLLWHCCFALAQVDDLVFQHLTRSNGLPVNNITTLALDSSGFVWIGSSEGLYRYDGLNFKAQYALSSGGGNSIPNNMVMQICVTRQGLLWIGTFKGGVFQMNSNGHILKVINSTNSHLFSTDSDLVKDVEEDSQGNIWVSTGDGLFRISASASEVDRFDYGNEDSIPYRNRRNSFSKFIIDSNDNIWIGNKHGMQIFDPAKGAFGHLAEPLRTVLKNESDFTDFNFYNDELWYSTWVPDLGAYDTTRKKHTVIYSGRGLQNPEFSRMANLFFIDSKNALWIGTRNGLFLKKPGKPGISASFFHDPQNAYSLVSNYISAILEDRTGNIWFGTAYGISIARPYSQFVHNLSVNNVKHYPFGDKMVRDIIQIDKNNILVGTSNADGLYLTDSNFNTIKRYSYNTYKYDWIWTHYDDVPRQRIFISTQEGMLVYEKKTRRLKIDSSEVFKKRYGISSFVSTADSILWMARLRGNFVRYNLNTGDYKEYDLKMLGVPDGAISSLEKAGENNIWILAGRGGLLKFDERREQIVEQLKLGTTSQSLIEGGIFFVKDLGDLLVIGYQSSGIQLYYKQSKTFRRFTQADGLVSDATTDAVVAKDGTVWIASQNGLIQFNPATGKFRNVGYQEGILSNHFDCITQLHDGRIAAGGPRGMIFFDPAEIEKLNQPPAAPVFTSIDVYGKSIPIDNLHHRPTPLMISYQENHFSFEFISLQYNMSRQLEYSCLLEGLDASWINTGSRRFISYSNVEGGRYTFRVRVRERGGEWVEGRQYLQIIVGTAFYKRFWFYVIVALAVVAVVYVLFRYRLQELIKLDRMRTNISSDLHDEVGTSLTSISIFSEMALKSISQNSKEREYLQRIGNRSRDSIEKMSDIVWSINPENDSLEMVLVRMKNYASEISEAKELNMFWNEAGNFADYKLNMEQRKNFYLLFKEAINNSIKHAQAKNISIQLNASGKSINLTIIDDGVGFAPGNNSRGNGIKNIHRRVTLLKGEIEINSDKGKGTSLHLHFVTN